MRPFAHTSTWSPSSRRRRRTRLAAGAALVAGATLGSGFTASPAGAVLPSADGKIAFVSLRDGCWDIYAVDADGIRTTNLINDSCLKADNDGIDEWPGWSPDGTKIAFYREEGVWVMNADGTGRTRLTSGPDQNPAWSPDGTKIAFSSRRDNNWELYVMNADGTGQTRLTQTAATERHPEWSPDGQKLAFDRTLPDGHTEVFVRDVAFTQLETQITYSYGASNPSWSPDGTKLAFGGTYPAIDGTLRKDIYVANTNGTNLVNLTPGFPDDFNPDWSPSGKKIVFSTSVAGDPEIFSMNADGSGATNLSRNPGAPFSITGYDTMPAWQPVQAPGIS